MVAIGFSSTVVQLRTILTGPINIPSLHSSPLSVPAYSYFDNCYVDQSNLASAAKFKHARISSEGLSMESIKTVVTKLRPYWIANPTSVGQSMSASAPCGHAITVMVCAMSSCIWSVCVNLLPKSTSQFLVRTSKSRAKLRFANTAHSIVV
mgnify:FL=1